ncbi:hypothetical protein [Trinickia mobilis]|uniref:hypothetical protein n=1 Tax=Trinickia mobilis TaxID=2816356 RepID=UPI001A8CDFF2|nr:hypothetical protein [Trinickia mobilis]
MKLPPRSIAQVTAHRLQPLADMRRMAVAPVPSPCERRVRCERIAAIFACRVADATAPRFGWPAGAPRCAMRLRLAPLGDVRLRIDAAPSGLRIEIRAARREAARWLARERVGLERRLARRLGLRVVVAVYPRGSA